jgi:hypothetical protein
VRRKWPEQKFAVSIVGDDVVCRWPNGEEQTISVSRLACVHVETNDSGPGGADVWFVLRDLDDAELSFPLGAPGERPVIDRLERLPGFEMRGMNSTVRARFLCWKAHSREGRA